MTSQYGIFLALAALVIVLLIILAIVAGLKRSKSKQVSFEKREPHKELTQEEKSGNYQAKGGFNFQAGIAPAQSHKIEPQPVPRTPAEAAPAAQESDRSSQHSEATAARKASEPHLEGHTEEASTQSGGPGDSAQQEATSAPDASGTKVQAITSDTPQDSQQPAETTTVEEAQSEQVSQELQVEDEPADTADEGAHTEGDSAQKENDDAQGSQPAELPATGSDTAASQVQREEIVPAAGRLGKLRGRLAKSNNVFGKSVLGMLSAGDLDDDAWEEIEDTLIAADLGASVTMKVVDRLREMVAERGLSSEAEARAMLREVLIEACQPNLDRSIKAMPYDGKPAVVLVAGVNGTGKTTTTGKLGRVLVSMGHSVVFGAADTFRAAAADQLEAWGRRVGAHTVRGREGADPASVAFDAVSRAIAKGADVVLIDTAGRLHTEVGLMDQLGKIKRVVEKKAVVDEVLLVLDATVGQNGLIQARTFKNVVDITGVVLTKLDGSAKGGIVFQVQEELQVPVKLVGLGEGADDLAPFEVESFIDALLA